MFSDDIQYLFFDMDGTLTDLVERWIMPVLHILEQIKPDYDRKNLESSMSIIAQKSGGASNFLIIKLLWSLGKLAGLNFFQRIIFFKLMLQNQDKFKRIILIDGVEATITELSTRYTLALITSASASTVTTAQSISPIFNLFSTIITRDDVEFTKPDPEPLFLAGKRLNIEDYSKVIMVGDFPMDVTAGKKAGTHTIAILGRLGEYTKTIIEESHPDLILTDITELLTVLK